MNSIIPPGVDRPLFRFATFFLDPVQRTLLAGSDDVHVGGKAFEILHILVAKRGAIVSPAELAQHVWPTTRVDQISIRVQIAALRKLLRENGGKSNWIKNVPRRGYCFAEFVDVVTSAIAAKNSSDVSSPSDKTIWKHRLVGREADIEAILELLKCKRTVSIVGSGGVGKTTVAYAIVRRLRKQASWRVCIAEMASANTEDEIVNAIAYGLGITVFNDSPLKAIERFIFETPTLIVLDNCEHVIEATASTILRLFNESGAQHFLVTSREPVRTRCEHVYRLKTLSLPSVDAHQDISGAMQSTAVQLFVERAQASGTGFKLDNGSLNDVCNLCIALDGLPLAIELAAAAVESFGIRQLANNLRDRFAMLVGGTRDAPPRHQSLRSVLDWSYETLKPVEQTLFCRTSLFFGGFDLDAAEDLLCEREASRARIIEAVHRLVDKSLLAFVTSDGVSRYVFPECTREYGRMLLSEQGDMEEVQKAKTKHLLRRCEPLMQTDTRQNAMLAALAVQPWFDDIRASVAWSLKQTNAETISQGIKLVWMSAPLWYFASSLHEFSLHLERAHDASNSLDLSDTDKFELSLASAHALFHRQGPDSKAAKQHFLGCLDLVPSADRSACAGEAISGLVIMATMSGEYEDGLRLVETYRSRAMTSTQPDPVFHRLNGLASYYMGDFATASNAAKTSLLSYAKRPVLVQGRDLVGFELRAASKVVLARTLWVLGQCDDAMEVAMDSVADAESDRHDLSVCYALASGPCIVAGWLGDKDTFHRCHDRLTALSYARGFINAQQRSQLLHLVQLPGEPIPVRPAEWSLVETPAPLHELMATLNPRLLTQIALSRAHNGKAGWATAEILRLEGEKLLERKADLKAVAAIFNESLNIARLQGALSWEIRTATSLAKLHLMSGRVDSAEQILGPIVGKYRQNTCSKDLVYAEAVMNRIGV